MTFKTMFFMIILIFLDIFLEIEAKKNEIYIETNYFDGECKNPIFSMYLNSEQMC